MSKARIKRERIGIYFDCIVGTICAIISLFAVLFVVLTEGPEGIEVNTNFIISITFWIFWLIFSLSIVGVGIYKYYEEKNYDKWKEKQKKKKRKLEPPII